MDIIIKGLEHRYQPRTPFERLALYDIDLDITSGHFAAIIGHTGSGKSTIIQHLNGLLKPTAGTIQAGGHLITPDKKQKNIKALRKKVGIVFQFPEHQLFEETIEKDICFGPLNFGESEENAKRKARESLKLVGLPEEYLSRSPFELSGGQMRRVAIAGVLAMEPDCLVLDEPTAGLDPRGRQEIMDLFSRLHKERSLTTILVTHSMEDAARYADEIIVMHKGTVFIKGTPDAVFSRPEELAALGLDVPETIKLKMKLEEKLGRKLPGSWLSLEDAVDTIRLLVKRGDA